MPLHISAPRTIVTATARLSYDTVGDAAAPPLVLIQGLGAQSLGWHPDFCRALADAGYHVIRPDNRDVGLSQKFPGGGYTLADMATDIAGLIDALGIDSAHIVGQSMGGMIAQELALRERAFVRSMTLIYTCAHPDRIDNAAITERSEALTAVPTNRDEAIAAYLENESFCAGEAYPNDTGWLTRLGGQMYDRDPASDAVPRQFDAILTSRDRRPLLPSITTPTAILCGDSDRLIDPRASTELHHLIPGSTLTVFEGMGHALPQPLWKDIVSIIDTNCRRVNVASAAAPADAR
ncbi:hypothetical protein CH267_06815 [Rhodococcus sp. 06-621-2]|nr:alpha/beta hydrolase [Rhodococcus sp. 06-621-2]OZC59792.1 hypothetical protein CH267_06815 [Rhodococcus sp. 06-621-2]